MEDIKEKTADELFSELGYIKKRRGIEGVVCYAKYQKTHLIQEICFNKHDHSLFMAVFDSENYVDITMQELQAINKKCKELRLVRR